MAGQKTISCTYQPPPEPPPTVMPISGTFRYNPTTTYLTIVLTFLNAMSTHLPANSLFMLKFDGNSYTPDSPRAWLTNKIYRTGHTPIGFDPLTATIDYDGTDVEFATATGIKVASFTNFTLTKI